MGMHGSRSLEEVWRCGIWCLVGAMSMVDSNFDYKRVCSRTESVLFIL